MFPARLVGLLFSHASAPQPTYTLSLHDALPICFRISPFTSTVIFLERSPVATAVVTSAMLRTCPVRFEAIETSLRRRSEEHTSELQSHSDLVCRLLLEKKNHPRHRLHHIIRQPA